MRGPGTERGTERPCGGAEWVAASLPVTRRTAGRMGQILRPWAGRGPWEQQRGLGKEPGKNAEHSSVSALSLFQAPGPVASLLHECFHCVLTTVPGHQ